MASGGAAGNAAAASPPGSGCGAPAGAAAGGLAVSPVRRALLLLRWPVLALLLWSAVWIPYQADRFARRGRLELAAGSETRALLFLREATFRLPIHSYYRHEMAEIYGRRFFAGCGLPHFSRAVMLNAEARRLNPREGRFLVFEAALWRRLSQLPGPWVPEAAAGARRLYEEALRLAPHQYQVPAILAEMDRAEGDRAGAVRRLEQALAEEPNFIRGRLMLAELLEEAGRAEEARQEREKATELARRFAGQPLSGGEYERELLALPGGP
jgi:tetratricopeptide (TPR) repeat protein